jgi:hypothetical protein
MLAAVDLDHEALFETNEVDDVCSDRMLPTKPDTQLIVANAGPEDAFRIGCLCPQFPCAFIGHGEHYLPSDRVGVIGNEHAARYPHPACQGLNASSDLW